MKNLKKFLAIFGVFALLVSNFTPLAYAGPIEEAGKKEKTVEIDNSGDNWGKGGKKDCEDKGRIDIKKDYFSKEAKEKSCYMGTLDDLNDELKEQEIICEAKDNCRALTDEEKCKEEGKVWDNGVCKSQEQVACEKEGNVWDNGVCKSQEQVACEKEGNVWDNGVCKSQEQVACEKEGNVWDNGVCKSQEQLACEKSDGTYKDNGCSCPGGKEPKEGVCVEKEKPAENPDKKTKEECKKDGKFLNEGGCVDACPEGKFPNKDRNECVNKPSKEYCNLSGLFLNEKKDACVSSCEQSEKVENGECKKLTQPDKDANCRNSSGEIVDNHPGKHPGKSCRCPEGTTLNSENRICESNTPSVEEKCKEEGKVWDNGVCKSQEQVACEEEGKVWDNGVCKSQEQVACEKEGKVWDNGVCKSQEQVACEKEGNVWDNGVCKSQEQVACEKEGNVWDNGVCKSQEQVACEKEGNVWDNGVCKSQEQVACEKEGNVWDNGVCKSQEQVACEKSDGTYTDNGCSCPGGKVFNETTKQCETYNDGGNTGGTTKGYSGGGSRRSVSSSDSSVEEVVLGGEVETNDSEEDDNEENNTENELLDLAYEWAVENKLINSKSDLVETLTRGNFASFMLDYITRLTELQQKLSGAAIYGDDNSDATQALYKYQVMGINADGSALGNFMPNQLTTKAESVTVFDRVLHGLQNNIEGANFHEKHASVLKSEGIIDEDINATDLETKGGVIMMMYRHELKK